VGAERGDRRRGSSRGRKMARRRPSSFRDRDACDEEGGRIGEGEKRMGQGGREGGREGGRSEEHKSERQSQCNI
jgi:hypothetical protein